MRDEPHRRGEPGGSSEVFNEPPGSPRRVFLHSAAFVALLGVWTWLLLEPYPVPPVVERGLSANLRLIVAKCLHAGVYAVLAVLAATLPVSPRWRAALVGLLALHGVGTEIGQTFVPNRVGKATDVLIDWAGVALGILVLRFRASRRT